MIEPKVSRPYWPRRLAGAIQRDHWPQILAMGPRAPRKITQLLDLHLSPRWPATPHASLGRLVAKRVLVQHRPAYAQGKKHRRRPSLRDRHREADEAVILEGLAEEIKDRSIWKQIAQVYNRKYGGDVEPLLVASDGCVFRVQPQVAFGQDEHTENFTESVTRWNFPEKLAFPIPHLAEFDTSRMIKNCLAT